ncbi:unnamed protein product, partial [Rotaria magnacalcarata]
MNIALASDESVIVIIVSGDPDLSYSILYKIEIKNFPVEKIIQQ